jgi:hypothetical protein
MRRGLNARGKRDGGLASCGKPCLIPSSCRSAPDQQSAEDYLERIHELIERKVARVVDIASSLKVNRHRPAWCRNSLRPAF